MYFLLFTSNFFFMNIVNCYLQYLYNQYEKENMFKLSFTNKFLK